ncbi:AraC family transcriptional regulator [Lachnospiraceae bacterium 29-84]
MDSNYKNSYKNPKKELVSLCVYNAGFQKCEALHQWGPGIRDHYLIHHIITGKGFFQVGGNTYELNEGDTFLVYPQTEATYYADAKNPWEYAWVGFSGSDAAMILKATDFSPSSPVLFTSSLKDDIQSHLMGIYEACGNGFVDSVEMTGRLYCTLALFMKHSSKVEQTNTAGSYVQTAIAYISANYSYPITVEDIANYVGVSRSHLFRSFERILQKSPKEYLTSFRIKEARYLLEHSSLSITAIANSVGFDNGLYFSKTFHKAVGVPPREYRQEKKNPDSRH